MRFTIESGLWTTGPTPDAPEVTAVLEVSGAVLSWTVDDPTAGPQITFTDPVRADWLWRILGEEGHDAVTRALLGVSECPVVEVDGATVRTESLEPLRRLALGHWLRRWWPASQRDGIAELDGTILDCEVTLLTTAAEAYLTDDTFDSDVAELLRPHAGVLGTLARQGDPRVGELVGACADLADEVGVEVAAPVQDATPASRDDYALVAGTAGPRAGQAIAAGVASVNWTAVPPRVFDAAEGTVSWRVQSDGEVATAVVQAELSGPASPTGIAVRVSSGDIGGAGSLDAAGTATIALVDRSRASISETAAWGRDWTDTAVSVGAEVAESPEIRDRVRAFARARLQRPGGDAFLAEVLAAESDY